HGEPGERYGDGGARKTTAKASGNGFALTGNKLLVVDGPSATHFVVSAALDDGSFGLFAVAAGTAGMTSEIYPLVDGAAGADLMLDGVQVDAGALIAFGADAEALLAETSDRATIALMAQAVGSMEA